MFSENSWLLLLCLENIRSFLKNGMLFSRFINVSFSSLVFAREVFTRSRFLLSHRHLLRRVRWTLFPRKRVILETRTAKLKIDIAKIDDEIWSREKRFLAGSWTTIYDFHSWVTGELIRAIERMNAKCFACFHVVFCGPRSLSPSLSRSHSISLMHIHTHTREARGLLQTSFYYCTEHALLLRLRFASITLRRVYDIDSEFKDPEDLRSSCYFCWVIIKKNKWIFRFYWILPELFAFINQFIEVHKKYWKFYWSQSSKCHL